MDSIIGLLGTIDKRVIYIIIGALVVLAVLSIIKKAVKLAIFICIVVLALTFSSKAISTLVDRAGISVKDGILCIDNSYVHDLSVDLITVDKVIISNDDKDKKDEVSIVTNKNESDIKIPNKHTKLLKSMLKIKGINVVDES